MEIPISETVTLASLGMNEGWLQERIWNTPSCLGLGELEGVSRERLVSSGGKLDILLKDPISDAMFEVEVMLGETDASHIMRSIEYWDLVRKKWPQRQHFAVLIAERITKRFFNVIQILSGSVPLIAIQVNAIKTPSGHFIHFTKVLDVYEEPDDEASQDGDSFDESFWQKKSNETLAATKAIHALISPIYEHSRLNFCKWSINIVRDGRNQMIVRTRSDGNVLIELRYGSKKEEIAKALDDRSIQINDKYKHFIFTLPIARIQEEAELFRTIAALNNQWWIDDSDGD